MLEKILQITALKNSNPLWLSLGPLLAFNVTLMLTILFFGLTYEKRVRNSEDVDRKAHSRFLSRFLKEWWYWFIGPFERGAVKLHLTPNFFTVCGFLLSAVSAYFFYKGMLGLGGWTMIFGATCDIIDGRIARLTGRESKSGAFFDSVMDRFGEAVVFLGLAGFYKDSWLLPVVILGLVGSMMVSYTRARGEGVGVECRGGIMQRAERIVYLGVGSVFSPILAYFLSPFINVHVDFVTVGVLVLIAVMTNLTALYRMFYIIRRLDPPTYPSFRFLAWWDELFPPRKN
ncbi:MAG: CDP-alcohol phosphatidyltransferase family protein [Deltaproteobacteria bacterium]|nr:CDP-alcohol phosphatidyltransferase family protein [Deltaproteobacteria bacterium]